MKKAIILIVVASLLMLSVASCFGNFALTRKVYNFNKGIGDKSIVGGAIRTLLFWGMNIVPIYYFAGLIDLFILNLIECLTGSNPLAMNDGETDIRYATHKGIEYQIVTTKNRFDISEVNNPEKSLTFVYDEADCAWFAISGEESYKITESTTDETKLFDFSGNVIATYFN